MLCGSTINTTIIDLFLVINVVSCEIIRLFFWLLCDMFKGEFVKNIDVSRETVIKISYLLHDLV